MPVSDTPHATDQPPASTRDYGHEAQRAAENHLAAIASAEELQEEGAASVDWPETAGPWCGCDTCVVRETLFAAWPILLDAAREQIAEVESPCLS